MTKPTMGELRNAAIDRTNALHADIQADYADQCRTADEVFDRQHDAARDHYERIRRRARPDHALLKEVRDRKLAEADKKLDDELKTLYLQNDIQDSRYN
jgi:ElaB/YqjD/DUF883 family membrane-anchored ribosome-binding protein